MNLHIRYKCAIVSPVAYRDGLAVMETPEAVTQKEWISMYLKSKPQPTTEPVFWKAEVSNDA